MFSVLKTLLTFLVILTMCASQVQVYDTVNFNTRSESGHIAYINGIEVGRSSSDIQVSYSGNINYGENIIAFKANKNLLDTTRLFRTTITFDNSDFIAYSISDSDWKVSTTSSNGWNSDYDYDDSSWQEPYSTNSAVTADLVWTQDMNNEVIYIRYKFNIVDSMVVYFTADNYHLFYYQGYEQSRTTSADPAGNFFIPTIVNLPVFDGKNTFAVRSTNSILQSPTAFLLDYETNCGIRGETNNIDWVRTSDIAGVTNTWYLKSFNLENIVFTGGIQQYGIWSNTQTAWGYYGANLWPIDSQARWISGVASQTPGNYDQRQFNYYRHHFIGQNCQSTTNPTNNPTLNPTNDPTANPTPCSIHEACNPSIPSNNCISKYNECSWWGDPHVLTFDGKWHHFQGEEYIKNINEKVYSYISQCNNDFTLVPFHILVGHRKCPNSNYLCTWFLWIRLYNSNGDHIRTLTLWQNGISDPLLGGLAPSNVPIYYSGNSYYTWDASTRSLYVYSGKLCNGNYDFVINSNSKMTSVNVNLNEYYKYLVCGLCGYWNDCKEDDFIKGPSTPNCQSVSTQIPDKMSKYTSEDWELVDEFGNSWVDATSNVQNVAQNHRIFTDDEISNVIPTVKLHFSDIDNNEDFIEECGAEILIICPNLEPDCILGACQPQCQGDSCPNDDDVELFVDLYIPISDEEPPQETIDPIETVPPY